MDTSINATTIQIPHNLTEPETDYPMTPTKQTEQTEQTNIYHTMDICKSYDQFMTSYSVSEIRNVFKSYIFIYRLSSTKLHICKDISEDTSQNISEDTSENKSAYKTLCGFDTFLWGRMLGETVNFGVIIFCPICLGKINKTEYQYYNITGVPKRQLSNNAEYLKMNQEYMLSKNKIEKRKMKKLRAMEKLKEIEKYKNLHKPSVGQCIFENIDESIKSNSELSKQTDNIINLTRLLN